MVSQGGAVSSAPAATSQSATDSVAESRASNATVGGGITNNQVQGVDEGDIVKLQGDLMIVLRRGRLFTISIAGGGMRPVSRIDVTPPGSRGSGSDFYDEMLVTADRVVVIGYSYQRGGTDIYRFRIDRSGKLAFEDAYQLRSSDYYSERNYASRMIGHQLILYSPLPLSWRSDPLEALPGLRRWRNTDDGRSGYRRIAGSRQIYVPAAFLDADNIDISTLHTVTTCDVTSPVLNCAATGVLGSDSRTFFVSQTAVYLWTDGAWTDGERAGRSNAFLYRMPLGGTLPSAIGVQGVPIDQFSFREDADRGRLNVMVRSEGGGDAMWRAQYNNGALALLQLPLSRFGDGSDRARRSMYRLLPQVGGEEGALHDRYVGDYLLYGASIASGGQRADGRGAVTVVSLNDRNSVVRLPLTTGVDRIEALGSDAVVVGSGDRDLTFTSIELTTGEGPQIGDRYVRHAASEAENRSHGFFYRPDPGSPGGADGILGLPITKAASPAFQSLFSDSAAMVYLRRQDRQLAPMGELEAADAGIEPDNCVASCADWYGNARPIFIGNRVFALLGYELVEGTVRGPRIREVGRISFAPSTMRNR